MSKFIVDKSIQTNGDLIIKGNLDVKGKQLSPPEEDGVIATQEFVEEKLKSTGGTGSSVIVDSELSSESTNPVQNKIIKETLDKKVDEVEYSKETPGVQGSDGTFTGLLYGVDFHNNQTVFPVTQGLNANYTIPLRNHNGNFYVSKVALDYECTNKKYVDNLPDNLLLTDEQQTKWKDWLGVSYDIENKVDKYTGTAGFIRLYGVDSNGNDTTYVVASSDVAVSPGRIAYYRTSATAGVSKPSGTLVVDDPVNPYAATNKKYVDNLPDNLLLTDEQQTKWKDWLGIEGGPEIIDIGSDYLTGFIAGQGSIPKLTDEIIYNINN